MPKTPESVVRVNRREFLQATGTAGGGLVLAGLARPAQARNGEESDAEPDSGRLLPWLRIAPDGTLTVYLEKAEMGQGVHASLAAIAAEELDVAWESVRVEPFVLRGSGEGMSTHSSASIRTQWEPLAAAGAAARAMLIDAAAQRWSVSPKECSTDRGAVVHGASGRRAGYGELALLAAELPVPDDAPRKPARDYELVGRSLPRQDIAAKVTGEAIFGIDVQRPGMLHAAIAMSPVLGGRLVALTDEQRAAVRGQRGVREIVVLPAAAADAAGDAVAVVADHYWRAQRALRSLDPQFSGGRADESDELHERMMSALDAPGLPVHVTDALPGVGDEAGLAAGERLVSARYDVPFLAHATLEPMNCTAHVTSEGVELWSPTQSTSRTRRAVSDALAIEPERVTVHPTLMGGGFGRRVETDFALQASRISRAVGAPVKLIWSREDDTRHDFYRPACAAELTARIDEAGRPLALRHHVAGPWYARELPGWLRSAVAWAQKQLGSPLAPPVLPDAIRYRLPPLLRSGVDGLVAGGGPPVPYDIADQRLEYSLVECNVRVGFWRSVSASQNVFFSESFIDELAHEAGADPLSYRRALLGSRERAVLDRAAEVAGWDEPLPAGRGRGIAFHVQHGTLVCQIAEVTAQDPRAPRILRIVCVVDCGRVVNPDTVRAQIEGSIAFGLSAALHGRITLAGGRVEQSNFHDYPLLGLDEMPELEIIRLDSDAPPGGIGEPVTPPVAPAVANAIFAATGQRLRSLPILPSGQRAVAIRRKAAAASRTQEDA